MVTTNGACGTAKVDDVLLQEAAALAVADLRLRSQVQKLEGRVAYAARPSFLSSSPAAQRCTAGWLVILLDLGSGRDSEMPLDLV